MLSTYTSQAIVTIGSDGISAIGAGGSLKPLPIADVSTLVALEIFTHHRSVEEAYRAYLSFHNSADRQGDKVLQAITPILNPGFYQISVLFVNQKVKVCLPKLCYAAYLLARGKPEALVYTPGAELDPTFIMDLTDLSHSSPQVALALYRLFFSEGECLQTLSASEFEGVVDWLSTAGLLTVPFGTVDFGDLRRQIPLCSRFGYSRGTPVDRYYLDKFTQTIRDEVEGITLEIGGLPGNQQLYGFHKITSYRTMDLRSGPGIDIVADASDSQAIAEDSLDSIVLFNVLEHCEKPWLVVANIYKWLKNGGKAFCMVPCAQRVHRMPNDYWRLLPDALEFLFQQFQERRLYVYGNTLASIASLMGLAAEELSTHELDLLNEEYPVASCIYAKKVEL